MIEQNYSLKNLNTFGVDVNAAFYSEFDSEDKLKTILEQYSKLNLPLLILGGGSNILFTKDFNGFVVRNRIQGISITESSADEALVKAGSGVVWHTLVRWCVDAGLGGIENLSLIPGCVGAAPIQNIGAYGVELKDAFVSLEAIEIETGKKVVFDKEQCNFGYRDSFFKKEGKGKFIITSVTLKLKKHPDLKLSYGAIKSELAKMNIENPDIRNVSDAVIKIRQSKLPDPAVLGNAGSFFKNPQVSEATYNELKSKFSDIVGYPVPSGEVKLAAGWMIEHCGWKGKKVGRTGSHKDQALVLVNYGNAEGKEVVDLAMSIKESVHLKFGVHIEPEVNII